MFKKNEKAYILLADGTQLTGYSVGAKGKTIGEVCFATGMSGYQETLTDPSFYGQIVTQTFPMIGNYGVNHEDFESERCYLNGYIMRDYCEHPSNFRCEDTLANFLKKHHVIGIYGIDTRALTRKIREYGVLNGMISTDPIENKEEALKEIRAFTIKDAVKTVSRKDFQEFKAENPKRKVALYDFGYKFNIRRELLSRDCDVTIVPFNATAQEVVDLKPDGIMLSNGPGDPEENAQIIEELRKLMETGIPMFGICLGHQLLALANGAKSEKLKYGHRGENQPVIDIDRDKTVITTQNHGFAILNETVPTDKGTVSHKNANDGSCEGIRYHHIPAFSVQFHPEACGGPHDSAYLFDEFMELMDKGGEK